MNFAETLRAWWRWLTTTRYTRALEEEVERLRAENRALTNSLLGTAGIPPIDFSEGAKSRSFGMPEIPRVRRRSWHQIQALNEIAQARRARPGGQQAPLSSTGVGGQAAPATPARSDSYNTDRPDGVSGDRPGRRGDSESGRKPNGRPFA